MKNKFAIVAAALVSVGAFAQKDELKTLKRIYDKDEPSQKDVVEYKDAVAKAEPMLASATEADKVYINYFKAEIPILEMNVLMSKPENQAKPQLMLQYMTPENINRLASAYNAVKEYEAKSGKKTYTKDIEETTTIISPTLLNYAAALGDQKNFAQGSKILYGLYQLDKKHPENLFYAASYAVSAQNYDDALDYYSQLKAVNYSGEGTSYFATSIVSGNEETFSSKADRDKMLALKTHTKPRDEKNPSKRGEIYKNVALILVQKGKTEEAKAAFADAVRENPEDTALMMSEANLYLNLNDNEMYKQKVAKILEKNTNDPDLYYNLGVLAMNGGQTAEAEQYFNKALQINPKYINSYLNLSGMKLKDDEKIVAEMNKLGTSEKDNKKYEVLTKQRQELFKNALPYLEKAYELDPKNVTVVDNLLSVYNFLEMTDKYKALKAKKAELPK